ncbi:MAG: hypothetical protein SCALA702_21280 [Melioribacteraceae bacterium]|nr:MAG: hypothetical protein SCALA702_21280 [Melioribacteraceae bacterium]
MSWEIILHDKEKIIEIIYEGNVNEFQLKEALEAGKAYILPDQSIKILADCSGLQSGASISELSLFIGELEKLRLPNFREAIILPQLNETKERVEYYEMACLNRGILVKIFKDRENAIRWLKT